MANMFGAINRFIARLDSDPNATQQPNGVASCGFQVLKNTNTALTLDPWFDFIIGINGHAIDHPDPNLFSTEVRNCAGSTISLGVYSAKGQQIREVYASVPQAPDSSLGLTLQWTPLSLSADIWHILDVMPNSPADVAGLLPYSDYVIGSPDAMLRGDGGLGELIEEFMGRALRLWVYNNEYDVTRMITITPAKHWGGDGALGCVLGYGALHRVPAPLNEPTQEPGETLFDGNDNAMLPNESSSESQAANFLVPANLSSSSTAGPPPPPKTKKGKVHKITAGAGMEDYFKEGEEQSRQLDNAPITKSADGAPPPPPKAK